MPRKDASSCLVPTVARVRCCRAATACSRSIRTTSVVNGFPTGYGYNRNNDRYISTPVERYLASTFANYKVTDGITAFIEATYSHVKSNASLEPSALANTDIGIDGIGIDNPLIPTSVAAAIAAANSDANPNNDASTIGFRRDNGPASKCRSRIPHAPRLSGKPRSRRSDDIGRYGCANQALR
jgi:hypothetical protein